MAQEWEDVVDSAPMTASEFSAMTLSDWLSALGGLLRQNLHTPLRLLAKLCGLLLLSAVGQSMCAQTSSPEQAALLDTVCALAAFALCAPTALALTELLQQAIETSRTYLVAFVPVFASVLTACGQPGGAALYSGVFFGVSMVMADVLCGVGLPVTRMLLAMNAAAAASGASVLSRLAASLCKGIKWALTLCATVFGALVALQSFFAQSADTLALRTGKFLFSSGVPVVGRAISDAMGSVLAGMKLLKGTVGFAVIAVLGAAFVPLLLQCLVYRLVFGAGDIIASAAGSEKSAKLLAGFSDCISLYHSMILFFALIVITATLVMILLGNGGM